MKKRFVAVSLILFLFLFVLLFLNWKRIGDFWYVAKKEPLPVPLTAKEIQEQKPKIITLSSDIENKPVISQLYSQETNLKNKNEALPTEINLAVPFTSQAPFGNWQLPYQEACEEASVLMMDYFLRGKSLSAAAANSEIVKLTEWEKAKFGFYEDTNAEQTAVILREYFGYKNVRVAYEISIDDIKKELTNGRPVIVPAAGRLLPNPFFHQPGPLYHMLVIKGYKNGKFITNDPGTRRGENFLYSYESLYNAIHDWNNGDVYSGKKAMIVVGD